MRAARGQRNRSDGEAAGSVRPGDPGAHGAGRSPAALREYRKKRSFARAPEPEGGTLPPGTGLSFAVQ
jgi:hypothetical protein